MAEWDANGLWGKLSCSIHRQPQRLLLHRSRAGDGLQLRWLNIVRAGRLRLVGTRRRDDRGMHNVIMLQVLIAFEADAIGYAAIFFDNMHRRGRLDLLRFVIPLERIGIDRRARIADDMDVPVGRHVVVRGIDFRALRSKHAGMQAAAIVKIDTDTAIEQGVLLRIKRLDSARVENGAEEPIRRKIHRGVVAYGSRHVRAQRRRCRARHDFRAFIAAPLKRTAQSKAKYQRSIMAQYDFISE